MRGCAGDLIVGDLLGVERKEAGGLSIPRVPRRWNDPKRRGRSDAC